MGKHGRKQNISVGLLAHVDAGKTTLAESLLYAAGAITKRGRVDHRDAYLDHHSLERERGITIFSKQAFFSLESWKITLLDTPGHIDFGAEMERVLQVLDYAILVVNGSDGVQSHTLTLWKLLQNYQVPVLVFVNKMDREENHADRLLEEVRRRLSPECLDFGMKERNEELFYEELAMKEERLLEVYLAGKRIENMEIGRLIQERKVFPVFFGSALRGTGIDQLLQGMENYFLFPQYTGAFGAKVFKIGRDHQNHRLTYVKITGGSLLVKQQLTGIGEKGGQPWQEKVDQIRIYSGKEYHFVDEVLAGEVCALTGLEHTYVGQGLGEEKEENRPFLEPVLTYQLCRTKEHNPYQLYEKLELLGQEDPQLKLAWIGESQEIRICVMGEIQLEVIRRMMDERFGMQVEFSQGQILYRETIADVVEGVGHFEPLRHYAEVHLLLEPLPRGSGLEICTTCSEDILDRNWQRQILTHLAESQHPGTLTGSAITDMRITLLAGRAHPKHTEGGDFRQATARAVRQGLRKAKGILLEPVYAFTLEVPQKQVGKAMADLQRMYGKADFSQELLPQEGMSILEGTCPVVTMKEYHREVLSYTQGKGRLSLQLKGYEPCHNPEQVIAERGYQPQADENNPCGSIFCIHGAGTYVDWDEVEDYMHLPLIYQQDQWTDAQEESAKKIYQKQRQHKENELSIDTEEIEAIFNRTFHANRKQERGQVRPGWSQRKIQPVQQSVYRRNYPQAKKEAYLLVDGYNIIFAWEELKELAAVTLDGARGRLLDLLCDYQGMKGCEVIVVFDAYRLQGHKEEVLDYHNIHVVYTKEAETADQYIEKFTHKHSKEYQITVATSDGLEQIIIRGQGCGLLSARDLQEELVYRKKQFMEAYGVSREQGKKHTLGEYMSGIKEEK